MRSAGLVIGASAALGCAADALYFSCGDDRDCVARGRGGKCQLDGYCSFSDLGCPSGQKYGIHAPDAIAASCVDAWPAPGEGPEGDGDADAPPIHDEPSGSGTMGESDSGGSTEGESTCGNGIVEAAEECDDGSLADLDTCSDACTLTGLVVHFRFDESSGLVATDSSNLGNTGFLIGLGSSSWITGLLVNAVELDGTGEVSAGSAEMLDDLGSLTVCAWIRPTSLASGTATIADKSHDGFGGGWSFFIERDALGFQNNNRSWALGAGGISPGAWHHVCAVWDGTPGASGIALYQDGARLGPEVVLSDSGAGDSDAMRDLVIGRANDGTLPFAGAVDDFRLYDRPLTAAEVESLFAEVDLP